MQNACFSPKCNKFRIAIQRLCMNQYPSFIYTKIQPYIFPMLGLRFLQGTGFEKSDESNPTVIREKK